MFLRQEFIVKFFKYSFVGIITTAIYFLCVFLIVELGRFEPVLGSAIAFVVMTVFSFILNVRFTFGSNIDRQKVWRFSVVALIGFLLNILLLYLVVHILHLHYLIGEVVTILVIPTVNFLLNNYWTFQREA
ncbi:GtrA family protein [Bacillus sp. B1-b2]|uniref:GtrA family protein n=1 Tax=Bacillus sp. B1-b2 TaxID=2653201 RepID=UPI001261FC9C|nr:GtrA family protein [Bacillus sp. B1-b2]KAB7672610.1 GtrA family protein [Bacillus sp. B1-b2]